MTIDERITAMETHLKMMSMRNQHKPVWLIEHLEKLKQIKARMNSEENLCSNS